MTKVWKILEPPSYRNINSCLKKDLRKNRIILSHWIFDIVKNNKNKIKITNKKGLLIQD